MGNKERPIRKVAEERDLLKPLAEEPVQLELELADVLEEELRLMEANLKRRIGRRVGLALVSFEFGMSRNAIYLSNAQSNPSLARGLRKIADRIDEEFLEGGPANSSVGSC